MIICSPKLDEKSKCILKAVAKGVPYLSPNEIMNALKYIYPSMEAKEIVKVIYKKVIEISEGLSIMSAKRHAIILIVDDVS